MTSWQTKSEEASIVFVGHFNPKIYHPEWYIRKGIYKEWDYESDKSYVCLPDIARCNLPDNQMYEVLLNRFMVRAQRSSDYIVFRDKVVEVLNYLPETPIKQMGMNYSRTVSTNDKGVWEHIGTKFVKRDPWQKMISYFDDLDPKKQKELGLFGLTYQFPRPDEFPGYIRAKIEILGSPVSKTLKIDINSHIEIVEEQNTAQIAADILLEHWEPANKIAMKITNLILN